MINPSYAWWVQELVSLDFYFYSDSDNQDACLSSKLNKSCSLVKNIKDAISDFLPQTFKIKNFYF